MLGVRADASVEAAKLIEDARRAGVELWVEGTRLRFRAADGALTDALREGLRARRDEIIARLRAHAAEATREEPIAANQRGLWFMNQLAPESDAYNVGFAAWLYGTVNEAALHETLQVLVDRHESLRTTYPSLGGEPARRVFGYQPVSFSVTDLAGLSEAELRAAVAREHSAPFDLQDGPVFRATLFRWTPDRGVLLLGAHHIAVDGTSLFVLLNELFDVYGAQCEGRAIPARADRTQFGDFVTWQHTTIDRNGPDATFWKDALEPAPAVLELPADRPRPRTSRLRGAAEHDTLDPELSAAIAATSRAEGVTEFVTMLALWFAFMNRLTGQDDVVVGMPVHGRSTVRFERTVGGFVNMLPIRVREIGALSFRELLRRVRAATMSALAHQDYPLPWMAERAARPSDRVGTPFQTLFALQDFGQFGDIERLFLANEGERLTFGPLTLSPFTLEQQQGQFDLTLEVSRQANALVCTWKYDVDLFDASTVKRRIREYATLAADALRRPEVALDALEILPQDEKALLAQWNATARPYPRDATVHGLFAEQAVRTPDAIAISSGGRTITYRELDRRSNQLAHHLRKYGVEREVCVALSMDRSIEMIVAILGILKAGGAYAPLDASFPAQRLAFLLDDTKAPVLLTQEAVLARMPREVPVGESASTPLLAGVRAICIDADWETIAREPVDPPDSGAGPESLVYVMYTSGSTGQPKGVCIVHRGVVRLVRGTTYAHYGPDEVLLGYAPISFDASTFEIWGALLNGGRLALVPAGMPSFEELGQFIEREGVTSLFLTSALFQQMVDRAAPSLRGVRQLLAGGDVLSPAHVERALDAVADGVVCDVYGPTENTTYTTCHPLRKGSVVRTPLPIGAPITNTTVHVLDRHRRPVPIGVVGELWTGGDGVARGYLNRPELTAERFVDDPFSDRSNAKLYRTGDLARWLPNGEIDFIGRADTQVKLRGFRVELGEIEATLITHPAVESAAVVAHGAGQEKYLVAFVSVRSGMSVQAADLQRFVAERLPRFMVPARVVELDELPMTSSGKVDRRALPSVHGARPELAQPYTAPRSADEDTIARICAEVLHVDRVGVDDNFFELGGHSLSATQVTSRIREAFHRELPLRQFFETPTVAEIAEWLRRDAGERDSVPPLRHIPDEVPAPASFGQSRLWFMQQLAPNASAYNIPGAVLLEGPLDVARYREAIGRVVRRQHSLRTRLRMEDGELRQILVPDGGPAFEYVDATSLPEAQRLSYAVNRAADILWAPYDLTTDPLLRLVLVRLGDDRHLLGLGMHHVIGDLWSISILLREIAAAYAGTLGDEPLVATYRDFAVWERERLQGDFLAPHMRFWKERLANLTTLDLPTDTPRPKQASFAGDAVRVELSQQRRADIERLSLELQATPFMTLLAVFNTLLYAITRQTDIAVGTPVGVRPLAELENVIGLFVNTLVHRTDLSGEPTFRQLVERVRRESLAALAHQDMPFELLVQELQPTRDTSRSPLFQVLFNVGNARLDDVAIPGVRQVELPFPIRAAQFDLNLHVGLNELQSHMHLVYNADLFTRDTAERLTRQFAEILDRAMANPDAPLADLVTPSAAELAQIAAWNATDAPYPAGETLDALLAAQVRRTPDAIAVSSPEHGVAAALTYRELDRRASALALRLQSLGVARDVPVAVNMERSAELIVALVGVLKAGGAYVPIDPGYPAERKRFMLEDCGAPVILTQQALAADLGAPAAATVLALDTLWPELDADARPETRADAHALAYMIYTSGSTGRPKGTMIEHRSIVNQLRWTQEQFPLTPADVVLQKTPYSFDVSVWELFWPLTIGARLVMARPQGHMDPVYLEGVLAREGVTMVHFVPSMLAAFLEILGGKRVAPALRRVVCSGEALSPSLRDRFFATVGRDVELINLYGPTEAAVHASWWRCTPDDPHGIVPIGWPVANTQLRVVDEQLRAVPIGAVGELCIGGAQVARGYLNRPELTAERFVADPFVPGSRLYRTGDKARVLANGAIEFLGRLDFQVKVRGFRIELGEIEARLLAHPGVRDAVVVAKDERLVAYVVGTPEAPPAEELRRWAGAELPSYMVPSVFVALDALPLTPSGKTDRKALPEPIVSTGTRESAGDDAPAGPEQTAIASIWCEVLGCDRVGAHEDFFRLGGHSLAAARVVARMSATLGVHLPLRQFFEDPTVAGLAAWIAEHRTASDGVPPIERVAGDGPAPLSFTQERLWFLQQLTPDTVAYNLSAALLLEGRLDRERLIAAMEAVIARHESLRTTFRIEGQRPVQVVATEPRYDRLVDDLRGLPEAERLERARTRISEEMERPYRMDQGPLVRVALVQLDDERHLLGIGMHHAVSDQWSFGVMVNELAAIYNAGGDPRVLAEPSLRYRDFVAWQRRLLESPEVEKQLAYWRKQLAGVTPLELPTDRPRPKFTTSVGGVVHATLPPGLEGRIDALGRDARTTPFVTMLAAFNVLLHAHSRQTDITVGAPIATRPHPSLEQLVGSFLNVLVHRSDLSGDPTFRELLARQRETALQATAHQDVPFERLVVDVDTRRDTSRTPLFQVLFNHANAPHRMDVLKGLTARLVHLNRSAAQFELGMHLYDGSLLLEYNADLFDHATAERMLAHYIEILERAVASPDSTLRELAAPSSADREQLAAWNATAVKYPDAGATLPALISAQVARTPNAIAVSAPDSGVARALTYRELETRASALAVRLQSLGVGRDVPVAVTMERSAELVVALVAVLKAGGAYVPVDPGYPAERQAFMLSDCGAPVVLTQGALAGSLAVPAGATVLKVDALWDALGRGTAAVPDVRATSDSLAYMIYTSGSTGRPKGAMIEHCSIVNRLLWMQEHFGLAPDDVVLQKTPYSFDVSVWEFFWPLLVGARLVMARPEGHMDPAYLAELIAREHVTTLHFVPSMLNVFLDRLDVSEVRSLRRVVCSGEALGPATRDRCLELLGSHAGLTNLYGPTEAAVDVSWWKCNPGDSPWTVPIGWPVANTQLHVLDEHMAPVPIGVPGELYIGGVQVGRGYLNRPELTAERFLADPFLPGGRLYRTGDKARVLANGAIEFLGRLDFQVKVRGFRIELGEVESALRACPGVGDAAVIAWEDRLVAYLVPDEGGLPPVGELRRRLADTLPQYMVPSVFVPMKEFPLSPSGKLDRRQLPEPKSSRAAPRRHRPPQTGAEQLVAEVWTRLLGVSEVHADDNFFELGGHSLLAMQVVASVEERTGLRLDPRALFFKNLGELAAMLPAVEVTSA